MTLPRELTHDDAVVRAAQWRADQENPWQPIMVELHNRFRLAHVHACEVHDLAGRMRLLRRAFG